MTTFCHRKKYINDGYSSSQNVFGHLTSSFKIVFLTANQVFMMTFCHRKNTLMMALVRHKIYLVVQLPLMKYFRRTTNLRRLFVLLRQTLAIANSNLFCSVCN